MSEFFHPKLQAIKALESYRLSTTWSSGEVLEVDVSNVMRGPAFTEICDFEPGPFDLYENSTKSPELHKKPCKLVNLDAKCQFSAHSDI